MAFRHDDTETASGSFAFTITDTAGNVLTGQSASVAVTLVNDNPPVANDDTDTTDEDTAISRNAAAGVIDLNDTDADTNASLNVVGVHPTGAVTGGTGVGSSVTGTNGGTFTINAERILRPSTRTATSTTS
ncbi:MAG: hypothetical protein U5O15_11060 [Candidatus Krumholzibacteriota bacterium]|nr:hypothetical protein [Candidatus Krumholzibacteriota bacterium]